MKSKRKLITTMVIAGFIILSLVATAIIVFAATQQSIKTSINITYKVSNIDGSVIATYKVGDEEEKYLKAVKKGGSVLGSRLIFSAGDTEDAGSFEFPSEGINLTKENNSVLIKYTYTNSGDRHFIATLDFDSVLKVENMRVQYGVEDVNSGEVKYSSSRYALIVPSDETKSYYIKISIINMSKDASVEGNLDWFLKGYDDEKDESYKVVQCLDFIGNDGEYSAYYNGNSNLLIDGNLVIPKEINGDSVTSILTNSSLTAEQKSAVTSVTIPASVTKIDKNAFSGFDNLTSVTFEEPNNWYIVESLENLDQAILLNLSDLVDTTISATNLNSTYVDKYWVVIK